MSIDPRTKSALLWGAVGFFTFLVLAQGSIVALGPSFLTLPQAGVGAVVVGATTATVAYRYESRVAQWAAKRDA